MFFQVPKTESYVPGMTLHCEVVPENIAVDLHEHRLVNEHLKIVVEHDGSNPFCHKEECRWGLIFAMTTENRPQQLACDEECPFLLMCLPYGVTITDAVIREATFENISGIWLFVATSVTSGESDKAFILSRYERAD